MRNLAIAVTLVSLGASGLALAAGTEAKVTGELLDMYCYSTMGAKGASHAQCARACAEKGIPVGILENGKLYVLLPNKDKASLPEDVIQKMGSTVTVTGKEHTTGGVTFLTVESVK
jgi:hypothetical protein